MSMLNSMKEVVTRRKLIRELDNSKFRERRIKAVSMINCETKDSLEVLEMYDIPFGEDIVKSSLENYIDLGEYHNTRTKVNCETCLEIDKLSLEKAVKIICEVCLSLMRSEIHFAVFYAIGQRSPHVRIYDLIELEELNEFQRVKAQIQFWRKHVPFGCFHFVDTGIFQDKHYLQLEFAIHWRHKTPFDLLFEYNPFPPKTREEMLKERKDYASKRSLGLSHTEIMEGYLCKN